MRRPQPIELRERRSTSRTRSCRTAAVPTATSTFTAATAPLGSTGTDEAASVPRNRRARDGRDLWVRATGRADSPDAARGRPLDLARRGSTCNGGGSGPRARNTSPGCDTARHAVSGLVSEVEPEHRPACAPERRPADADGVLPHRGRAAVLSELLTRRTRFSWRSGDHAVVGARIAWALRHRRPTGVVEAAGIPRPARRRHRWPGSALPRGPRDLQ